MQIRDFKGLEADGKASLKRLTDELFEVRTAHFDSTTGERSPVDRATAVMLSGLRDAIGQHEKAMDECDRMKALHALEIEGINTMIADMEKANALAEKEAESTEARS